ncbi:hypothetical protein BaRGS_00016221, partial [Batillaria attramentaria]
IKLTTVKPSNLSEKKTEIENINGRDTGDVASPEQKKTDHRCLHLTIIIIQSGVQPAATKHTETAAVAKSSFDDTDAGERLNHVSVD